MHTFSFIRYIIITGLARFGPLTQHALSCLRRCGPHPARPTDPRSHFATAKDPLTVPVHRARYQGQEDQCHRCNSRCCLPPRARATPPGAKATHRHCGGGSSPASSAHTSSWMLSAAALCLPLDLFADAAAPPAFDFASAFLFFATSSLQSSICRFGVVLFA